MKAKQIDKKTTVEKLVQWESEHYGHSLNLTKLMIALDMPDWEKTLKKVCKLAGIPIVYNEIEMPE